MIDIQLIIDANAEYAKTYKDVHNHDSRPKQKLAIITCMDAWIHEADAFGIKLGDAHIIRNAGGSASEGLRSLIVSQQLLETDQVMVVKHTRCGMEGGTNGAIRSVVKANTGHSAGHIDFLPFAALEQAVRDDVVWLKGNEFMAGIKAENITGWIFHLSTGFLQPVR